MPDATVPLPRILRPLPHAPHTAALFPQRHSCPGIARARNRGERGEERGYRYKCNVLKCIPSASRSGRASLGCPSPSSSTIPVRGPMAAVPAPVPARPASRGSMDLAWPLCMYTGHSRPHHPPSHPPTLSRAPAREIGQPVRARHLPR